MPHLTAVRGSAPTTLGSSFTWLQTRKGMTALLPCSHLCDACTDDSAGVSTKVQKCVSRQKRRTQLALLTLKNSRQSLFVPELLVPDGWSTATLNQPRTLYKVVAAVDGRLVSIYDSVTQYKLGQTLHAKRGGAAWAPLHACYFAFPTMQQAASAVFPRNSQLAKAARMLIEEGESARLV
ncbi:hypothetical protein WJX79_001645 [Trebouxia sp. C0005]